MKKNNCIYTDLQKIDLRVGEIKTAAKLEGSEKLLILNVDFGPDYGTVEILSGIAKYYKPEKLIGNKYLFIANLEPRKLMGRYSNGMIFATESKKPHLIKIGKRIPAGTALC